MPTASPANARSQGARYHSPRLTRRLRHRVMRDPSSFLGDAPPGRRTRACRSSCEPRSGRVLLRYRKALPLEPIPYEAAAMSPSQDDRAEVLAHKATPRGKYPHYRRAGDFIYVSGTSSRRADDSIAGADANPFGTMRLDIREQTRAVIENLRDILAAADATLADVVEISTFLVDMNDFGGYNEVYGEFFGFDGPARTTVAVHQLPHPHLRIEMKAVAYKPQG